MEKSNCSTTPEDQLWQSSLFWIELEKFACMHQTLDPTLVGYEFARVI